MSLRWRLTLLFASLLGGVVLIFGSLAYGMVSLLLLNQVDDTLAATSENLLQQIRINLDGSLNTESLSDYHPWGNQIVQIWTAGGDLIYSFPLFASEILDPTGRLGDEPFFTTLNYQGIKVRVLNLPLRTNRAPFGMLQIGLPLTFVDQARHTLAGVLLVLGLGLIALSVLISQALIRKTQAPLNSMTEMATLITATGDLSRRIPLPANTKDEVGQLVLAFNQTLERLEQLFLSQRRLLSDVSHELRTPLTVIKGNLSLMQQMGCNDPESVKTIQTEVDRLNRLVGDLLLLGQVESGRLTLNTGKVQLDELVLEVVKQLHTVAAGKVELKVAGIDQIVVMGDRDRLKQVLLNLGSNAVQYTPSGGLVAFSLQQENERAIIDVTDSGPGIAAEDLRHIFERFYRGERSRTRSHGVGFGLGLSIADWIAKAHGGELKVKSKVGEGSVFSLILPLKGESCLRNK